MNKKCLTLSVFVMFFGLSCRHKGHSPKLDEPQKLHLRKITVIGHRGSEGATNNSIAAFQKAVSGGASIVELDLQLTKDNIPLVAHDGTLSKSCRDPQGKILEKEVAFQDLTAAEAQQYDCGAAGKKEHPLLFRDMLRWLNKETSNVDMLVEIKGTYEPQNFIQRVVDVLKEEQALHHGIFISFNPAYLKAVRELEPTHPVGLLTERADFCQRAAEGNEQYALPGSRAVTKEEVEICHTNGIKVFSWTVNSEAEWQKLVEMDVDGIITDRPGFLVDLLD